MCSDLTKVSGAERGQRSAGAAAYASTDIFSNGKTLLTGTGRCTTPLPLARNTIMTSLKDTVQHLGPDHIWVSRGRPKAEIPKFRGPEHDIHSYEREKII